MEETPGLGVELVSVINKLQDVFAIVGAGATQINLPQICVVGSQSSGKSSVLENIVGRDFLPRGNGIVTRRPLVLQLINRPTVASSETSDQSSTNKDEWGEFLHLPGRKFFDFSEIRKEIVRDTDAKTGKNAGISPSPINLRIYSPRVLTLTLVDLPGLTKVPVGDQPRDIEIQIRNMLMTYIKSPTCIILAVTAANQDLANSEALKMAREVDPEGLRTIGVLTKIDLMDAGTDVVHILAGRVVPLWLGYVPVVSRGQKDIDTNKPISYALDKEREFFENHAAYRARWKYCGTPFLVQKLNNTLKLHIRNTLPTIKASIAKQHQRFSAELKSLGDPLEHTSAHILLSAITEFNARFRGAINGENGGDLPLTELSGGARISFVFHHIFSNGIKSVGPFDQVKDGDLRTTLYNSSGLTPTLFIGTAAFEDIIKRQIARLEEPSLRCCQLVHDELLRILSEVLAKMPAMRRYPALRERLNSVVVSFFKESMGATKKLVSDLVAMQVCYVNTTHPDFIGGHKATAIVNERLNPPRPPSPPETRAGKPPAAQSTKPRDFDPESTEDSGFFASFFGGSKSKPATTRQSVSSVNPPSPMEAPPAVIRPQDTLSAREKMEIEILKLLIDSYIGIVKREMIDTVPKAISLKLVGRATKDVQRELLEKLYKPEEMDSILKESEAVVSRRKELSAIVEALDKADEIVAGV
ncbi:Dynamin central region-domain-containing protein [Mycena galericulata]|nr:Dynamin central region-domain-containing protein [Mycena galericulata]KAJ7509046.1 Dynamin central region-domain-containing protein [Mycena galericulata]